MKMLVINKRQWKLFNEIWGEDFVEKHFILDEDVPLGDVKITLKDAQQSSESTTGEKHE